MANGLSGSKNLSLSYNHRRIQALTSTVTVYRVMIISLTGIVTVYRVMVISLTGIVIVYRVMIMST